MPGSLIRHAAPDTFSREAGEGPCCGPAVTAADAFRDRIGRRLVLGVPAVWLAVFFLVPFLIVAKISLSTPDEALPPYTPTFAPFADSLRETWDKVLQLTLDNYHRLFARRLYFDSLLSSLWIASAATALTLAVGYPVAYGVAQAPRRARPALLLFVMLPFFTSFLIRVYAWITILAPQGLLNSWLIGLGVIHDPIAILSTNRAVFIGLVYSYLPFMALPLYAALEKIDPSLCEAAKDLGATALRTFWRITLPLSLPGVLAGSLLVFIPVVGEFVIPDLLGGSGTEMLGKTLWEEFFNNHDWPTAAALAIALLVLIVLPIVLFQAHRARLRESER